MCKFYTSYTKVLKDLFIVANLVIGVTKLRFLTVN